MLKGCLGEGDVMGESPPNNLKGILYSAQF